MDAIDAEKISYWLFKVALNQYYDLCRKKQKLPLASLQIESLVNNMQAEDYLPEDYVLDNEKRKQIERVLHYLNQAGNRE